MRPSQKRAALRIAVRLSVSLIWVCIVTEEHKVLVYNFDEHNPSSNCVISGTFSHQ